MVVLLLYSELNYFLWPGLKFRFAPDADMHAKLKLNVDMTIAMPCDCKSLVDALGDDDVLALSPVIGADILDKTNTNAYTFGRLREEPTWWELEEAQRIHFDEVSRDMGRSRSRSRNSTRTIRGMSRSRNTVWDRDRTRSCSMNVGKQGLNIGTNLQEGILGIFIKLQTNTWSGC